MKTPKIKDDKGNVYPNSIAEITKINIGGTEQYIMVRGRDVNNPVILFVHGGPGQAEIGYTRYYQKELEEHFVVVRWDQRGAGLSYSKNIPKESFTVDTFVSDADEMTDYLIARFNKSKIIIAGHSWGTVIGTYAAKNHPEKYFAYVGVGQVVDMQESVKITHQYTYSQAKKQNNKKVLHMLDTLGEPPYSIKEFFTLGECMGRIGGFEKTKPPKNMQISIMLSTEYSLLAKLNYFKGLFSCATIMYPLASKINLFDDIKRLDIPVIFIAGKYDYTTPTSLAENFYNNFKAPKKEFIVFENSAHMPQLEESKLFNDTIINIKKNYVQ